MEALEVVKGVFLHSRKLNTEFMMKCLQMLVNNFPDINITSVVSDELHFGYRVHFSSPGEEEVLAKKHLLVSGENVPIGPLRTTLTIHGIQRDGGEKFEVELREQIGNKFGKLLYIIAVTNPENETTKNLRACVDVPELEELEVFNHEGSPDMFVCAPDNSERFKVTFHCRRCANDGHVQQNCPNLLSPRRESSEQTNGHIDSRDINSNAGKPFPIRLESTNSYAEKIGREEILKRGILSEGNENGIGDKPGPSSSSAKKKTEFFPFLKIKEETEEPDDRSSENRIKRSTNSASDNEDKDSNFINDDDEVQVIDCREVSNSSTSHHSFTIKSENRDEDTNSNDNFSSAARYSLDTFSSSSTSVAGPSSRSSITPTKPTIAVEVTKVLSPQLQSCINSACEEFNILDRSQLDAFLIHVKKKSNPLRIANNYTNKADRLKDQLQKIIKLFYSTPQAGTKDDTQFIKWLTGLVERFEGTVPKKRKRSDHSDSPKKK